MHNRLGQERMQVIVVNDFPSLYNPEGRANRLMNPPAGLGDSDRNGTCAVVAGKSISLRRRNADFPVLRKICCCFCRRIFRDITLTVIGKTLTHDFLLSSG